MRKFIESSIIAVCMVILFWGHAWGRGATVSFEAIVCKDFEVAKGIMTIMKKSKESAGRVLALFDPGASPRPSNCVRTLFSQGLGELLVSEEGEHGNHPFKIGIFRSRDHNRIKFLYVVVWGTYLGWDI